MPRGRLEQSGLNRAWIQAEASLPIGWRLSGMVSEGEAWRAWAEPGPHAGDPDATPIEGHGPARAPALQSLARNARIARGQVGRSG